MLPVCWKVCFGSSSDPFLLPNGWHGMCWRIKIMNADNKDSDRHVDVWYRVIDRCLCSWSVSLPKMSKTIGISQKYFRLHDPCSSSLTVRKMQVWAVIDFPFQCRGSVCYCLSLEPDSRCAMPDKTLHCIAFLDMCVVVITSCFVMVRWVVLH